MNQRRTIVNTALSNRSAGTVILIAAVAGGLYSLFCLLRLPSAAYPHAGVILSAQAFEALAYLEWILKIIIKAFLIAALLVAFSRARLSPYTRTPARLWACSLVLEIVLYVRSIFLSLTGAFSAQRLGGAIDVLALLKELVPSVLSILTFSLLIVIALRSADVLRAARYFRLSLITTLLAILFLAVHAIALASAVGVSAIVREIILLADGLTVLLPGILLMRAAAGEKKVNYTSRGFYMGQKYER